jgi:hypothetical protein
MAKARLLLLAAIYAIPALGQLPFTGPNAIETLNGPAVVRLADLDRDGDPDLAAADNTKAFWWQNDGMPADGSGGDGNSWTEALVVTLLGRIWSLVPGDVDRDGDVDLMLTTQDPSSVSSWLENGNEATV